MADLATKTFLLAIFLDIVSRDSEALFPIERRIERNNRRENSNKKPSDRFSHAIKARWVNSYASNPRVCDHEFPNIVYYGKIRFRSVTLIIT